MINLKEISQNSYSTIFWPPFDYQSHAIIQYMDKVILKSNKKKLNKSNPPVGRENHFRGVRKSTKQPPPDTHVHMGYKSFAKGSSAPEGKVSSNERLGLSSEGWSALILASARSILLHWGALVILEFVGSSFEDSTLEQFPSWGSMLEFAVCSSGIGLRISLTSNVFSLSSCGSVCSASESTSDGMVESD